MFIKISADGRLVNLDRCEGIAFVEKDGKCVVVFHMSSIDEIFEVKQKDDDKNVNKRFSVFQTTVLSDPFTSKEHAIQWLEQFQLGTKHEKHFPEIGVL